MAYRTLLAIGENRLNRLLVLTDRKKSTTPIVVDSKFETIADELDICSLLVQTVVTTTKCDIKQKNTIDTCIKNKVS